MPVASFDIYQTADGYIAVANPVRRKIMRALSESDLELPELVALTGKAKPTLSSVHMRDLVAKNLVCADTHPTDSRRKVYRLIAQKIGSSEVPIHNLRDAVQEYATSLPLAARYPLAMFIEALVAAPEDTDPETLHAQARGFGALLGRSLQARDSAAFVMAVVGLLEQEGVAKPLRLDLEQNGMELAFGSAMPEGVATERLAHVVAGLVEGMGRTRWFRGPVRVAVNGHQRRCHLAWS